MGVVEQAEVGMDVLVRRRVDEKQQGTSKFHLSNPHAHASTTTTAPASLLRALSAAHQVCQQPQAVELVGRAGADRREERGGKRRIRQDTNCHRLTPMLPSTNNHVAAIITTH